MVAMSQDDAASRGRVSTRSKHGRWTTRTVGSRYVGAIGEKEDGYGTGANNLRSMHGHEHKCSVSPVKLERLHYSSFCFSIFPLYFWPLTLFKNRTSLVSRSHSIRDTEGNELVSVRPVTLKDHIYM